MNLRKKEKFVTEKEALIKIYRFCTYQERNQQEVRQKLQVFGLKNDKIEEIIVHLIQENFLNEERFAKLYAGSKFRVKNWGKRKIEDSLTQKDISSNLIKIALKEISDEAYIETIGLLIEKKSKLDYDENLFRKKGKVAQYLIGKGYEPELVWEMINTKIDK